jgi:CO/xanthine dehydrogenase Mo-binding subunit
MSEALRMDRREFTKRLGGGIFVLVSLPGRNPLESLFDGVQQRGYPTDINAYLHIAEDGTVTFFSGKIEMGQGVMTSLTQMAAEELRAPLDAMRIVMGDTDTCPYDAGTWGSLSVRVFGPAVRAACAQARLVLTDLAAARLGVARAALTAADGAVHVTADPARRVTYGELARGQKITHTVDERAVLRAAKEFTVMGTSPLRLDGVDKVTGTAKYAGDIRLPGMLYARILRPPAHGATLARVDTTAAERMEGVTVVNQDGMVAVLAADPETAERALGLVQASFDVPPAEVDTESIFDHIVRVAAPGSVPDSAGDLAAGRAGSTKIVEATYRDGYFAHAPIEPHTALAEVKDGRATVWSSTQSPFGQRATIAQALGLDQANVRVITPYVGGGFGGKAPGQQAVEAALLARITGRPVQVQWTRAEEFFYDTYRAAAVMRHASGIDRSGKITFWDYEVFAAGARGSEVLYDVPNRSVRVRGEARGGPRLHPFATGAWRAPGASSNRFAIEQQVDAMAAAAGTDPLEFRLKNTTNPRLLAALRLAAEAYGWTPAVAPCLEGRGRGLACGIDAETYVAVIADVTVDRSSGDVRVDRVVCAQDMGIVVNPDGARQQMEGCIVMGLGYALSEEIRFEGGRILVSDFDTYQIPRFSRIPRIETAFVPHDDLLPTGGGEPGIINVGAAIANAIFDATGKRVYRLPMTRARVLAALADG